MPENGHIRCKTNGFVQTYPSKLLLFGEHAVTLGAPALALPTAHFSGAWAWHATSDQQQIPVEWAGYLRQKEAELLSLGADLQIDQFEQDLAKGLYFNSNIPVGYGLGSSGALCAAVYERYAATPIGRNAEDQYPALKAILALMESFFHGASSGLDPLISYVQKPLLLKNQNSIESVKITAPAHGEPWLFLLDTQIPRRAEPLILWFRAQMQLPDFKEAVQNELVPYTREAIACVTGDNWQDLSRPFEQISRWQQRYLQPMIPATFSELWQQGLDSGKYFLKLCGAGGGGFLLGWAQHEQTARASLPGLNLLGIDPAASTRHL